MKKTLFYILILCFIVGTSTISHAQGSELYGSGIKFKLNEDGSKYVRMITWHQIWARYTQNNEGSARQTVAQDETFDIGIRRSRFLFLTQISPRFLIVLHAGINNQTSYTGGYNATVDGKKPQLFMHDVWNEYKVFDKPKFKLDFGAGLHYWHGVSRMSSASTLNFLAIDAPIFNWSNIEATDQFARYIGLYAKGKVGKLDYRLHVSEPFLTNTNRALTVGTANYSPLNVNKIYAGYLNYQFFDQESNVLPFTVGTYVGSKKVFNIGAGFSLNNDAMWSKKETWTGNDSLLFHDQNLFAVDAFLDIPINKEKGTALTTYIVNYIYDFGPNFVRSIGIMNPASGNAAGEGVSSYRGNAVPLIGTGNILHGEVGFLLPKSISTKFKLQPYTAFTMSTFEGVKDAEGDEHGVRIIDAGANIFLEGHHAKITLNYRHRPDFSQLKQPDFSVTYKPEITVQFQVYL